MWEGVSRLDVRVRIAGSVGSAEPVLMISFYFPKVVLV